MILFPSIFTRMETAYVENEISLTENSKKSWIRAQNEKNSEGNEAANNIEKIRSDWIVST